MFEEKFLEPHFTSVLAPYMLDVVEQKRALGNKYNAGVEALSAFDDFCNEQQLRIPPHTLACIWQELKMSVQIQFTLTETPLLFFMATLKSIVALN